MARDAEKFANLVDVGDCLASLRAVVEQDLAGRRRSWDRSVALVVRLSRAENCLRQWLHE